jgi:hypothetical protein
VKLAKLILAAVLGALVCPTQAAEAAEVRLQWDYPTNDLSEDLWFNLYSTTNIAAPLSTWPMVTNFVGTSTVATVSVPWGEKRFFTVIASNYWGEFSAFSNVTNTPAATTNITNLKIMK